MHNFYLITNKLVCFCFFIDLICLNFVRNFTLQYWKFLFLEETIDIASLPVGIFVALALRFDASRGKNGQYFTSAFAGYTFGLVLTIIVMNWFQAAQVTFAFFLTYTPPLIKMISEVNDFIS